MRFARTGPIAAAAFVAVLLGECAPSAGDGESAPPEVAVRIAQIESATLRGTIKVWGTVEPRPASASAPAASASVGAPMAGVVVEARCAQGERVGAGDVLFVMDPRVAEVRLSRARAEVGFAERAYERQKKLIEGDGTSQKLLQEAESRLAAARGEVAAAQADLALLTITAPLAGTVTKVLVRAGEAVDPNRVLAEVVDLDRLEVSAGVPSGEVRHVATSQPVEYAAATGSPGADGTLHGTVVYVGAEVDPATDAVPVRTSLPPRSGLRPGEFTQLRIVYEEHRDCLAVPRESIVKDPEGRDAIAIVEDGTAQFRPVSVGLREGDRAEVSGEGLRPGLSVITEGSYGLPDGTRVRVITTK